jgi:hypothetical protein
VRKVALASCCGLVALLAGFGVARGSEVPANVNVQLTVTTYDPWPTVDQIQTFTLTCDPVGGTMPLADRMCNDIEQHPAAMLAPRQVGPQILCGGIPNAPTVSVSATANGVTNVFGPSCDNPGGVAASIYWAAARNDEQSLDELEPQLVCDEDPGLYRQPTFPSIFACLGGLWTDHAAQAIRTAETTSQIAKLAPRKLFPHRIGAQACTLPGSIGGQCGVLENESGSASIVTFVEYWGAGALAPAPTQNKHDLDHNFLTNFTTTAPGKRHNWRVVIRNDKVVDVSQSGPVPPQLRH